MTGRRTASALPRLLPDMRRVGCAACGTIHLIPTWNEPEPEPPLAIIGCDSPSCGKPFEARL